MFVESANGGLMAELLESIGLNLRRLREEKGWNQTELGFRADTSPSIISLIENGKRNPSTATLAKIAGALDVEVADLFPKGGRRSLPEPSLFNDLEDERHPSIFVEAVMMAADKLNSLASEPSMNKWRRFGIGDAAIALIDALHERITEEAWETLSDEERLELVDVSERLLEVSRQSIERADDEVLEKEADQRREQIREWTQRISA